MSHYLRIFYPTAKRLAKLHGILREVKNQPGKGLKKYRPEKRIDLDKILSGEFYMRSKYYLKLLLIRECIFPEECFRCGFNQKRPLDYMTPLVLDFINADETDKRKENMRLLCANCGFIEKGEKRKDKLIREYNEQLPGCEWQDI